MTEQWEHSHEHTEHNPLADYWHPHLQYHDAEPAAALWHVHYIGKHAQDHHPVPPKEKGTHHLMFNSRKVTSTGWWS